MSEAQNQKLMEDIIDYYTRKIDDPDTSRELNWVEMLRNEFASYVLTTEGWDINHDATNIFKDAFRIAFSQNEHNPILVIGYHDGKVNVYDKAHTITDVKTWLEGIRILNERDSQV